jgi:flavin reductase (DIM6/NTAB) family NADH-FMN oxidoreductase RutF
MMRDGASVDARRAHPETAVDPLLPDTFRHAMRRLAASVCVVTCRRDDTWYGMTATAVTSLCVEPPSLLVCIHRDTTCHAALSRCDRFCMNVPGARHQQVSATFGRKADDPAAKFAVGDWRLTADGLPYLADTQSNLVCRIASVFEHGTHSIFVGQCETITNGPDAAPLLYANGAYGTLAAL